MKPKKQIDILAAIADPNLFAPWFRDPTTWAAWRIFLAALFALPIDGEQQLAVYREHTGRSTPPAAAFNEAWLICGRRGGKSFVLAVTAVFLACFRDYAPYLAPVPLRGKRNEPAFVKHTAAALAALKGVAEDELAQATTANFFRLFRKAKPSPAAAAP